MQPASQTKPGPLFIAGSPSPSAAPLGHPFRTRLLDRLRRAANRPPDEIIGSPVFLNRWDLVPRTRWRSFYLHEIFGSDNELILHDHPWPSLSFVLKGAYVEHTIRAGGIHERRIRKAGDIIFRLPATPHRLEMPEGAEDSCWTLFLAGPRVREWGFHSPDGWIPWKDFAKRRAAGASRDGETRMVTDVMAEAADKVLAETVQNSAAEPSNIGGTDAA